jgi:hypothetical protein
LLYGGTKMSRLGELLYWMACWIAAIVAILGLNALIQGGDTQSVVGVIAFFVTAGIIWLLGRVVLLMSRK